MLTNAGCRALCRDSFAKMWLSRTDTESFPRAATQGWLMATSSLYAVAKRQGSGAAMYLQTMQPGAKGAEMFSPAAVVSP